MNRVATIVKNPNRAPWTARLNAAAGSIGKRSGTLLNSYSEIFFLQHPVAGLVLLATTFMVPNVGIAGLVSVAAAYLFARLIGMQKAFLSTGFFTYNALLVGLSIGYLFKLEPTTLFFVATAGVLSYVLSVAMNSVFSLYFKLPILSLPFVIVSSVAWLASQHYSALYIDGLYAHAEVTVIWLPTVVEGFLTALGAILFTPHPLAGFGIAVVLLWHSRILFLLAVGGYLLGASLGAFLGVNTNDPFADINHFNYILVAMALGGIFLVPSPRSLVIAAVGVAVSTLLLSAVRLFWSSYGIPAFTLPFNLVTLGFLYVLGTVGFELVAQRIGARPEDTLDDFITLRGRFQEGGRELILPFAGSWTVWQGFDGRWTHTGSWRYAYDFVMSEPDADGELQTHAGDGSRLEDYYAWQKPVMSPCRGRVVRIIDNLPDNPPGHVDSHNNWGNLVIIETTGGWFVEMSHFAEHSIEVSEGDWVEPGHLLGLCGNSGYSAQPHIHLQAQQTDKIGDATLPFQFLGYLEDKQFIPVGLPAEGARVEALLPDRALEYRMAIPLDTQLSFRLDEGDADPISEGEISVHSNAMGETYLRHGESRLYFTQNSSNFYFYRLEGRSAVLRMLHAALPRLPLAYDPEMRWEDLLPLSAVRPGWQRMLVDLGRVIVPSLGRYTLRARWSRNATIEGEITGPDGRMIEPVEVVLHERLGVSSVRMGARHLQLEAGLE